MLPDNAVGPRIKRISNALDRKRTLDMEDVELTSSQGFVLGYLTRHSAEPVTPGDLGRHFNLSHPTVTGILQRLEAKGFLRYVEDSGDRRKKRICVTEKALDVHQQVLQRFQETEALITQGMTQREIQDLLALLDRIINNVGAAFDGCAESTEKGEST